MALRAHPLCKRYEHGGAADEVGLHDLTATGDLEGDEPGQQFFQHHAQFLLGQVLADAHVRTVAEGDLPVGLAVEAELAGRLEDVGVAVRGLIQQHQPVTLGDLLPAQQVVLAGLPDEMLDRRDPAQPLVDETGDERRIGLDPGELAGILS